MQKSRREAEIGDLTAIVQQEKKKVEEAQAGGKRMKVTHKGFEEIEDDPVAGKNQLKTDEIDYDLSKKLETENSEESSKKAKKAKKDKKKKKDKKSKKEKKKKHDKIEFTDSP